MKIDLNIHIHLHNSHDVNEELLKKIFSIVSETQKSVKKMSQAVDDLKAKIQAQSDALDQVSASVEGITADVTFLKDKLSQLPDGATAEEIAELSSLVDGLGEKVTAIGTATSDLDASTDSSGQPVG